VLESWFCVEGSASALALRILCRAKSLSLDNRNALYIRGNATSQYVRLMIGGDVPSKEVSPSQLNTRMTSATRCFEIAPEAKSKWYLIQAYDVKCICWHP